MRGDASTMTVARALTPEAALKRLAKEPKALVVAGGTDVMVLWNLGLFNGRPVLDISGVKTWRHISADERAVTIGALATHAELRDHAAVRASFPLLSEACATIGAVQIQNRGTIGGNLANASPAGDTFPPLAVYDAVVNVVSSAGRRALPLREFFAGVKRTTLRPGELVESVTLPLPARPATRRYFRKVGTRAAQAISKTVAAGQLWLAKDGTVEELRFALGSVAPTVRRLSAAEVFLRGKPLLPDAIAAACGLVEKDISPIDDIRSTRDYRLAVSRNLLRDFLEKRK